ncbi:MAG: sugar ABC transporter ATP-binding protein [Hyphomicrobiales bacterium]|nr:MAG: sugar ABC transporter ATP-binding protein [Hyphomicrobiales bacterium]
MPLLEVRNLHKHYPGVAALKGVDFSGDAGEVHAIVGANGAGKSTLMNLISGATAPTGGDILLDGAVVKLNSPQAAQAAGIATVYQEFSLVPQLSVARNIFLGREPRGVLGLVDEAKLNADATQLLSRFHIALDPRTEVADLSVAEQQMVEIVRALSFKARILILDEPTAVLSLSEQDNLFAIMRQLRSEGMLILYVSHRLEEILAIADRVTVVRDGSKVGTRAIAELTMDGLVNMMIGESQRAAPMRSTVPQGAPRYDIAYTTADGTQQIAVQQGEILGLAGLVGAGRTTFARALAGMGGKHAATRITLDGKALRNGSPEAAMRDGVVYLTEDRKRDGIFAGIDIIGNATAAALPGLGRLGLRDRRKERERSGTILKRLRLVAASLDMPIGKLSGGNQQKVVLGRALMMAPKLLICDEPTRGVDVGAKSEIHDLLRELAAQGAAIIVISSEIDELLGLAHRIVVMNDRRFVAEMPVEDASEAAILTAAAGGTMTNKELT